jgi:hypothetical protein
MEIIEIPEYYCKICKITKDHKTKACKSNTCHKCNRTGHVKKDCNNPCLRGTNHEWINYLNNAQVKCGCNENEVKQIRLQRSHDKGCIPYDTHCCKCKSPHPMRNLTICRTKENWNEQWNYICFLCIKIHKQKITPDQQPCETEILDTPIENVYANGPVFNPTIETHPYQPSYQSDEITISLTDLIASQTIEENIPTELTLDQNEVIPEEITPEHLMQYCNCNPNKNPRPNCPYHQYPRCLCYNKNSTYCGKCNHKTDLKDSFNDCMRCHECQLNGISCSDQLLKWTQDFGGPCAIRDENKKSDIECDYPAGHSHNICKKHKRYFDLNQERCSECISEMKEKSQDLPDYNEAMDIDQQSRNNSNNNQENDQQVVMDLQELTNEIHQISEEISQENQVTQQQYDQRTEINDQMKEKIKSLEQTIKEKDQERDFWFTQWQFITQQHNQAMQLAGVYQNVALYLNEYQLYHAATKIQRMYKHRKLQKQVTQIINIAKQKGIEKIKNKGKGKDI